MLEYKNMELGESYLVVNLVCQCDWPTDDPDGVGFPEDLHQEGAEKKWRMTWNTKVVCRSCPPAPPPKPRTPTGPDVPKAGTAGWGKVIMIVLVLLAVLGAGGFAMWKKDLLCRPKGRSLGDALDAPLDADRQAGPDWSASSGAIGGAE